jgi:hypothetical protein
VGTTEDTKRLVRDRLNLVRHLLESDQSPPPPENAGIGRQHELLDSLASYLLLTCFDALGQRDGWVDFSSWLASAKPPHAAERLNALSGYLPQNPVADAKHLHREYAAHYGARTSFMNFIDKVLSAEAREKLLDSVFLQDLSGKELPEKDKKDELYRLRNGFTHRLNAHGTPRYTDGSRHVFATLPSGAPNTPHPHLSVYRDDRVQLSVADWPFALYECVAGAIGEKIPDFSAGYAVTTWVAGDTVTHYGLKRADVNTPHTLRTVLAKIEAWHRAWSSGEAVDQTGFHVQGTGPHPLYQPR